jgi:hypothetical protein
MDSTKRTTKRTEEALRSLERRFRALSARLARTRWVLLGTVQTRQVRRAPKPDAPLKDYGPYYQWTFKRDGKTHTVQLSAAQAAAYRRAVAEHRALERTVAQMRTLSEQYLNATIEGVQKRKCKDR